MSFARFTSRCFIVALAVPTALVAMQLPALTNAYQADLVQAASSVRAMIDDRERAARAQYSISAQDDGGIVTALQAVDPTNADSLSDDLTQWRGLADAAARIVSVGPTSRAFAALIDLAYDPRDSRGAIWRAARDKFVPRLTFETAGIVYAIGGLMFGVLVAQTVLGIIGLFRPRYRARA